LGWGTKERFLRKILNPIKTGPLLKGEKFFSLLAPSNFGAPPIKGGKFLVYGGPISRQPFFWGQISTGKNFAGRYNSSGRLNDSFSARGLSSLGGGLSLRCQRRPPSCLARISPPGDSPCLGSRLYPSPVATFD